MSHIQLLCIQPCFHICPSFFLYPLSFSHPSFSILAVALKSTYPQALFESVDYLNEAQKSNLADAIWAVNTNQEVILPKNVDYVLDGGALLHRIPWINGSTYRSIIEKNVDHVIKKYGKATIIFDGYVGTSTKDMTHRRRAKGKKGLTVSFSLDMCLAVSKDNFLCDSQNKRRFIHFLSQNLESAGCKVF